MRRHLLTPSILLALATAACDPASAPETDTDPGSDADTDTSATTSCADGLVPWQGDCIAPEQVADVGGSLSECPVEVLIPLHHDAEPNCDYACHGTRSPGLDYDGALGDPLFAPVSGTVITTRDGRPARPSSASTSSACSYSEQLGWCCNQADGFGNHVVIKDRRGREWTIGHLDLGSLEVAEGQVVAAGQRIGEVGNSGYTCSPGGDGSHVHVSVRHLGAWWDFEDCVDGHGGGVEPLTCWDGDRDTYGLGPDCDAQDCDDTESAHQSWDADHLGCLGETDGGTVCADRDGDGASAGAACPWPDEDCDDFDSSTISGCQPGSTPTAPPAPTGIAAAWDAANEWNLVTWNASAGALQYFVHWKEGPGVTLSSLALTPTTTTDYGHSGVVPGHQYCYRVRAVSAAGDSPLSTEACATVPSSGPPATPLNPSVAYQAASSWNYLTWTAAPTATSYTVFWRAGGPGVSDSSDAMPDTTTTDYGHTGVVSGATYCYRVRANNAAGHSGLSAEACTTVP